MQSEPKGEIHFITCVSVEDNLLQSPLSTVVYSLRGTLLNKPSLGRSYILEGFSFC